MNSLKLLLIFMIASGIFSCGKQYPQQDNNSVIRDNPNGIFYINAQGNFIKLNPASDSVYWASEEYNCNNLLL